MIKHVKFKKLGKLASPLWVSTICTQTKGTNKEVFVQKWGNSKKELEEYENPREN